MSDLIGVAYCCAARIRDLVKSEKDLSKREMLDQIKIDILGLASYSGIAGLEKEIESFRSKISELESKLAESEQNLYQQEKGQGVQVRSLTQQAYRISGQRDDARRELTIVQQSLHEAEKETEKWEDHHWRVLRRAEAAEKSLREANLRGAAQDKRLSRMKKLIKKARITLFRNSASDNYLILALDFCRQSDEEIMGKRGAKMLEKYQELIDAAKNILKDRTPDQIRGGLWLDGAIKRAEVQASDQEAGG